MVNTLAINLSALAVLWYSGVRSSRPSEWPETQATAKRRLIALSIGVLVLFGVLGAFTWSAYQSGAATEAIRNDVDTVPRTIDGDTYHIWRQKREVGRFDEV